MRVDVWDIKKPEEEVKLDCGYPRNFPEAFTFDKVIGKGGFGLVRVVVEKSSGQQFACKSIKKKLDVPNVSAAKQTQHLENIDREVKILKRLRGTLSVVHFKGCWEDDSHVHMVMEYCTGGELHHVIGQRVYTEETVAGYMRSVLHTLAQCHSHHILHRDVKPGNFMLLDESEGAPLKAIDFGLAVFFEPEKLPRTDLGLDGTPWFMAPEVLSSTTYPSSDVWSAGIMCYQLLCGYLPFDDARNPDAPALSIIWKGILTEEPSFRRSAWQQVSPEAKDFVTKLLNKDQAKRPTAKDALGHPWLQTTFHAARRRPLDATVVQRIQRYAQSNLLRRTILELIANELLKIAPPRLADPSLRGGGGINASAFSAFASESSADGAPASPHSSSTGGDDSGHGEALFPMSPDRGSLLSPPRYAGMSPIARKRSLEMQIPGNQPGAPGGSGSVPRSFTRSPSLQQLAMLAKAQRRGLATVHGPGDYWRIMRQASELAAIGSGHGQMNYLRAVPRSEEERLEQRKAARLSLDTSAHGGDKYAELMTRMEAEGSMRPRKLSTGMRGSQSLGSLSQALVGKAAQHDAAGTAMPPPPPPAPHMPLFPPVLESEARAEEREESAEPMQVDMEKGGRGRSAAFMALRGGEDIAVSNAGLSQPPANNAPAGINAAVSQSEKKSVEPSLGSGPRTVKRVHFDASKNSPPPSPLAALAATPPAPQPSPTALQPSPSPGAHITNVQDLESLMRRLQFRSGGSLSKNALADGLRHLGYDLAPSEVAVLMDQLDLDSSQTVDPSEFVASQLDWGALQNSNRELWLECARRAFADLDVNADGRLTAQELVENLRSKLPAQEVDYAVEDALIEAGMADAEDIDFEGFLRMLRVGSMESLDSLDQYDPRLRHSAVEAMDLSTHGIGRLTTVPEEKKI